MSANSEHPSQFANQVVDECESTNDLAKRMAEAGYPHGTWVSARRQTRGRGRLGRSWQQGEGNLFFSMIARIPAQELWTWIPLATAVAVVRAIRDIAPGAGVRIKWPNDLWIGTAKLGGILCEGSIQGSQASQVIGVGVNCASLPESVTDQPTSRLTEALGRRISADDLREPFRARLWETLEDLQEKGSGAVRPTYEANAVFESGSSIEWGSAGEKRGTVIGLGDAGELWVRTEQGAELALLAEDVSIRGPRASYGSLP